MSTYLLGIDIGTSGSKALLINARGELLASVTAVYPMYTPHPMWAEQDPADWWNATITSIRKVMDQANVKANELVGIGLTGQMHGLVLIDSHGDVLRPCIMWNDQRTAKQCAAVTEQLSLENVLKLTGNQILPGFTAPKIKWVNENEPQVYKNVAKVLLPKDYIRFKLSGEFFSEVSDASGTSLFDVRARKWSVEMLKAFNVPADWMPEVTESPVASTQVSPEAALETGLLAGIPVIVGAGDQAAQAVGVGAVVPGVVALTVGTSGVVFAPTQASLIEPEGRLHSFCHAVPEMWHFMGVMLSAAGSLKWFRNTLAPKISFDELLNEAEAVPTGSEGLQFLPYLSGERTPYSDPLARGAFIGITIRHERGHMTRAVLEGVAFGLKDSFMLIKNAGLGSITQVRASGGGTKGVLWGQILASVLEAELVTVNTTEGAAYGAALLAGVGVGAWPDVPMACRAAVKITGSTLPDATQMEMYRKSYALYCELYPALKASFAKMGLMN